MCIRDSPNDASFTKEAWQKYQANLAQKGNILRVQAADGLQFAPTELTVAAGSEVVLAFENPDIMEHNWVLISPGNGDKVGALADILAGQPDGAAKEYLPESDHILQATKLVGPGDKTELTFIAPTEPGEYPYLCTFPGHWRIMKGVLKVTAPE